MPNINVQADYFLPTILVFMYEVEGTRPRGRPNKTWREIVETDCRARGLNTEDAMDRSR